MVGERLKGRRRRSFLDQVSPDVGGASAVMEATAERGDPPGTRRQVRSGLFLGFSGDSRGRRDAPPGV